MTRRILLLSLLTGLVLLYIVHSFRGSEPLLPPGSGLRNLHPEPSPDVVSSPVSIPPAELASERENPFQAFDQWVEDFLRGSLDAEGIESGKKLAVARAIRMKALIQSDPEEALKQALSEVQIARLPEELLPWIEQPIHQTAQYDVVITCGNADHDHSVHRDHVDRTLHWQGERLKTFTYGRRTSITTKASLSAHGIALDGLAALSDQPIRVLDQEAKAFHGLSEEDHVVQVHGEFRTFASLPERDAFVERFEAREFLPHPQSAASPLAGEEGFAGSPADPIANSPYTEGAKTLLYIRARLSDDDPGYEPISVSQALSREADVEEYFQKASYNKLTSWSVTVTDVIDLTQDSSYYNVSLGRILPEARTTAKNLNSNWDYANYDFYVVVTRNATFTYAGRAYVGSRGAHLAGYTTLRTAGHEYGHNLGLWHSWYWRTDSESPIGRDSNPGGYVGSGNDDEDIEYGHFFDIMSAQSGGNMNNPSRPHFSAYGKNHIDWLPDAEIEVVTSSQLVRMYTYDHPDTVGTPKAIHIDLPSNDYAGTYFGISDDREYWLQFRSQFNNDWASNGIQVDWNEPSGITPTMIDMTPFSDDDTSGSSWNDDNSDKDDGILLVGRTYSDYDAPTDIHFTPIAKGGSGSEQYLDIQIYVGTAASNTSPEITAFTQSSLEVTTGETVNFAVTASDTDGDTLAYAWYFGDNSLDASVLNNPSASKSWSSPGEYVVRTVVSDMKGGVASESVVVRVGDPSDRYRVHGRVLWGGRPVADARVFIGNSYQARTDSNGSYVIANLPDSTYTVECDKYGLTFTPQFTNPVDVGPDDGWGIDFHANEAFSGSGSVLTLSPFEVQVSLGETVEFDALLWNASGVPSSVEPSWSVDGGGSIASDGVFTPSAIGGPFTVTGDQGGVIGTATLWVDGNMTVSVEATDANASESGPGTGTWTFTRTGTTTVALEVFFSVTGSATEGLDYSNLPSSVTLPVGQSSVTLDVTPLDDADMEGTETVVLSLNSHPSYSLSEDRTASVEIADSDSVEHTFLLNFAGGSYTSDGVKTWQSFDLASSDSATGDPQHVNPAATLQDVSGSGAKGVTFQTSGGSNGTVSSPNTAVTEAMIPGNPYTWFDTSVAAQREVFTLQNGSSAWNFTFAGVDSADLLVAEFVFARDKTGDRAMTVSAVSNGDVLNDAQVDEDGGPQFPMTALLTGASSHSFSLIPSGTGWGCLPNAMRVRVISPLPTAPSAPSSLVASAQSSSRIDLTWSDTSSNETGFKVQRSETTGGPWFDVTTTAANVTVFSDTGLTASTEYFYQILATNGTGDSAPSNEDSDTTSAPTPGTLELELTSVTVAEADGTVTLMVSRSGGASGAVQLDYATSNGTALSGSDYTAVSGTLSWTDGDSASKSIVVPLIDDNEIESDEIFSLILSNPGGGATLGVSDTATVTVTSEDAVETVYLINLGLSAYTTDGTHTWQTFNPTSVNNTSTTGDPVAIAATVLADTAGATSAGVTFATNITNGGTSSVSLNNSAPESMFSVNPYSWFNPSSSQQREVVTMIHSTSQVFTFGGFSEDDTVDVEFVFGRNKTTGDRAMTVTYNAAGGDEVILNDQPVHENGGPQYPLKTGMTGQTSYSFTLASTGDPSGSSWGCLPNVIRVRVNGTGGTNPVPAGWVRHTVDSGLNGADGIRSADVDQDGDLDVAVGWEQSGVVRIYQNPGTASATSPWSFVSFSGVSHVEDAALVDLDGDGRLDVVASTENGNQQIILLFAPPSPQDYWNAANWTQVIPPVANGQSWMFAQAMDVDGLHGPDIVAGSKNISDDASVSWLQAPADPRIAADWTLHKITDAEWVMSIVLEDMDGDSDLDVLISDREAGGARATSAVRWLENPGTGDMGILQSAWTSHLVAGAGEEVMFLDVVDLDEDGLRDVVVPVRSDTLDPNEWLLARRLNASGTSWSVTTHLFPDHPEVSGGTGNGKSLVAADMNNDGQLDLVAAFGKAYSPKQGMIWMSHDGDPVNGTWSSTEVSGPEGNKFDLVVPLDLDGDGDLDLISTEEDENVANNGLGLVWYENPLNRPTVTFENPSDLDLFVVEQRPGGSVSIVNGELVIDDYDGDSDDGATVWYKDKLTAPYVITYQVRSNGAARVSDVNCFWSALDTQNNVPITDNAPIQTRDDGVSQRDGNFGDYDYLQLYYVGMGGNNNTTTRYRRYPGDGTRPLLPEHDLNAPLLTGDQVVQIEIRVTESGTQYLVDGTVIYDIADPAAFSEGWFAFRTVDSEMIIDNFSARSLAESPWPAAPTGLSAETQDATTIQVSWTDTSDDESGFLLQRASGGGAFTTIATPAANLTGYTDTVSSDVVYTYRILSTGSLGDSQPSGEASASTKDSDTDGMLDDHEILAGSNPNDDASRFVAFTVAPTTGDIAFQFPSSAEGYYRVFYSDSLISPVWEVLTTLNGTGAALLVEDSPASIRYYKIEVRSTPWP